ncbi:DUF1153 domain-containing protein [Methylocella sp. CPCC 101449]|uniref:DUF1153 domain-containing protein n=1 Tax=Methylocella sp. CPCC 101449 TaxID=2987531 RepID=UPI0039088E76
MSGNSTSAGLRFIRNLDLESSASLRWSPRRKALLIRALLLNTLSLKDAETLYHVSAEEIREWSERYAESGLDGLKAYSIASPGKRRRRQPKRRLWLPRLNVDI